MICLFDFGSPLVELSSFKVAHSFTFLKTNYSLKLKKKFKSLLLMLARHYLKDNTNIHMKPNRLLKFISLSALLMMINRSSADTSVDCTIAESG